MQRLIKLTENVPEQTFLLCSVDNTCNIHNHSAPPPLQPFLSPSICYYNYVLHVDCMQENVKSAEQTKNLPH